MSLIAFYFLWNEGPTATYISELMTILMRCWEIAINEDDESVPLLITNPEFILEKSLLQVKGANTHGLQLNANLLPQLQNANRFLHMEVVKQYAPLI